MRLPMQLLQLVFRFHLRANRRRLCGLLRYAEPKKSGKVRRQLMRCAKGGSKAPSEGIRRKNRLATLQRMDLRMESLAEGNRYRTGVSIVNCCLAAGAASRHSREIRQAAGDSIRPSNHSHRAAPLLFRPIKTSAGAIQGCLFGVLVPQSGALSWHLSKSFIAKWLHLIGSVEKRGYIPSIRSLPPV